MDDFLAAQPAWHLHLLTWHSDTSKENRVSMAIVSLAKIIHNAPGRYNQGFGGSSHNFLFGQQAASAEPCESARPAAKLTDSASWRTVDIPLDRGRTRAASGSIKNTYR
jgi:hypothetical protein